VTRVVFIATPHRGSFRVTTFVRSLVRRLVTLPSTVVQGLAEVAQSNPNVSCVLLWSNINGHLEKSDIMKIGGAG